MVRTVRVRLELDRSDFKQGLRDAANDTREFDGEVQSLGSSASRTGIELKDTDTAAKKLGDDVKQSSKDVDAMAGSVDKAGTSIKSTGDKAGKTSDSLRKLKTDLENIKNEGEKLAPGGNNGGGLLNFALDEWAASVGKATARGAQRGLNALSGTAPTGLMQWLVAGALAASPAIAAAINTAMLLGAGGIGLAGGIALAAQSPIVRSSYADLGHYVHDQLTMAVSGLDAPVAESAGIMRGAFNQVLPGIMHDFDVLAPSVEHVASGIASLVVNAMPGFNRAIAASVPLLNKLGDDTLPRMGSAISYFFDSMARGEPGAEMFLHDFTTGLDLTLKYVGNITLALDQMYRAYRDPAGTLQTSGLTGVLGPLLDKLDLLDGKAKKTAASMDPLDAALARIPQSAQAAGLGVQLAASDFSTLSAAIARTATTSDALAGQMVDRLVSASLSVDQTTLGVAQAQTQLAESFKTNTVSARNHAVQLDITTASGQANRSAILGVVQANLAEYDANIRVGMSAEDAAVAYNTNTGALERQMRQAGLTQGQIDGLIGKYRNVPSKVDTDIATRGLTEAINGLTDMLGYLNHVNGYQARASVTVTTDYVANRQSVFNSQVPAAARAAGSSASNAFRNANRWGGAYEHAASGLLREADTYSAKAPARYAFAEPATRGEAFVPKSGNYGRSMQILNRAAGWYGASVVPGGGGGGSMSATSVNITVNAGMGTDGTAVGRQIAAALKPYINDAGGGNVQNALGRRGQ